MTAFSTASAPELNSTERFSPEPGVSRLRCSATATYCSYGVTMKQVWVKSATCARTASTTRGAELPMVVTAMPEPKSMSRLPSTSSTIPPAARAANTGIVCPTLCDTAAARRLVSSSDAGPGISVTRWRLCSTADTSAAYRCRAAATTPKSTGGGVSQRSAHIRCRVPILAGVAVQRLRPDAQRPAHIPRRIPPLARVAVLWIRRAHGRHCNRQRSHR